MFSDLRFALRQLRKSPAFTATALLTLALGIGAATAIFSIVDAVILRPLPYPNATRLVRVYQTTPDDQRSTFSGPDFVDFRREARVFSSMAAYRQASVSLTGNGPAVALAAVLVTPAYFDVFGVPAAAGRTFRNGDAAPGARAVVLSHAVWQQHFGGAPSVIGRVIFFDREAHTVLGVMPERFRGFPQAEVWILAQQEVPDTPFPGAERLERNREVHYLSAVARLAAGVSRREAEAALQTVAARLADAFPASNRDRSVRLVALHDDVVGGVRPALVTLLLAVGVLLAAVAANVASLLIARAAVRAREMSIRAAIGAPRRRLFRQLLVESLVLGLLGGLGGFTVALWTLDLLVALGPGDVPRLAEARVDLRVFAFSAVVSIAVAALFGLVPALHASRADLVSVFRQGVGGGRARQRLRSALVAIELAAAVVLLMVAGLVTRSFLELQRVDLGYDVENVYTIGVPLPETRYTTEAQQAAFFDELLPRLAALPGVRSAAAAFPRPLSGGGGSARFDVEGRPPNRGSENVSGINWITPEYFRVLGIPLVAGRVFDARDRAGTAPVIVVNERMASRYWPGENAVGRRIRFDAGENAPWHEVVGIVGNTRAYGLGQAPRPEMYVPLGQNALPFMTVLLRAGASTGALLPAIRAEVSSLDPALPAGELRPLGGAVDEQLAPSRFRTVLLLGFSGTALLLAGIGIYGLIAYSVAQRTAEIGIRLALGASRAQVRRLVMRQGLPPAAAGLLAGLAAAFISGRWLSSILFEVRPADPATLAGALASLLAVAASATYLPARRATRIDPMKALRAE